MSIPCCVDMYFANLLAITPTCSHGCLAEWNVLSMGVRVSQGQDTRMTLKCFLLPDPMEAITPISAGWICEVRSGYQHTHTCPFCTGEPAEDWLSPAHLHADLYLAVFLCVSVSLSVTLFLCLCPFCLPAFCV